MGIDRAWIDRSLARPGIREYVLSSLNVEQRMSEVARFDAEAGADRIGDDIDREAATFASGLMGVQRFHAGAYGDNERLLLSTTFLVDGAPDESDVVGSFPPTIQGAFALQLAHNQALAKMLSTSLGAVVAQQAVMLREAIARGERLLEEKLDSVRLVEDLVSAKHTRDVELRRLEAGEKRKDEMLDSLAPVASAFLAKVSGQQLVRQKYSEVELAARAVAQGLTMDQMDVLRASGAFRPEQLLGFATLLETLVKAELVTPKEKKETEDLARKAVGAPPASTESP